MFNKTQLFITLLFSIVFYNTNAQINTFPYTEDFEANSTCTGSCNAVCNFLGGWVNDASEGGNWITDIGGTSSGSTGPSYDHTLGTATGKYLYFETSSPCYSNVTANLISPTFDFTSAPAPQVSFWYHMYGSTQGSLHLEASSNGGVTWTTLWTISGQQHTSSTAPYTQAVVNASAYGGFASVIFRIRGVSSTSFTSDMAIDDFLVENILPNNAGVSALVNPPSGGAAGNYPVDVTLENYGSNNLDSVTLEWELNGVPQTSVFYSGPQLAPFSNTNVNLSASVNFPTGLTNVKVWTSNPNGVADVDNGNDTLNALFCTGLSGTYTVGTATADFVTINDALTALYNCGMAGPVTMQVAAGSYTTPINIDQPISNISATNTLTFDGSAKSAIITVASDAAVKLDGAKYVTIQDFTLVNSGTSTSWGVLLTGGAEYNSILNNRIQMAITNSFTTAGIVASGSTTTVSFSGVNASYTLVEGNEITGADRGITFYGSSSIADYNSGNTIRNNIIRDADNYGIYCYYQDSLTVEGNHLSAFPSTLHYGIYCYYIMNFAVNGNYINSNDYGLYMGRANSQTVPTLRGTVANNMITTENDRAFYLYFPRSMDVYHNTLVSTASAFVISTFDNTTDIRNNIFVSKSQSFYAFESFSSGTLTEMDHNVFYTDPGNPNLIFYQGAYADLADWQANGPYGFDQNSLEGLPNFVSATDLHVDGVFLNDMGVNTTVTVDYDGETRPAAGSTNVDIGADEFTPPSNDAGVLDLVSPQLPISAGFQNVQVSVKNFGVLPLNSFYVEWQINGISQPTVPYSGASVPVGGTVPVILANINFPPNTTSLKFWTSLPNGVIDERFDNDTLEIDICTGLVGTYTVGQSNSDFPTVAEAIDVLNNCGVSGPVTMLFEPGSYTGPWVLNEIPGASSINTVTFDGQDADLTTLTHNGFGTNTAATLILNGTDHFVIRNFTIVNTGLNTAFGVILTNDANYNTIEENNIQMLFSPGLTNVVGILSSASLTESTGLNAEGINANYTTISSNTITGGEAGIILEGGASDVLNIGNQILDNDIYNASDYGVYVDEQDSLVLRGNYVHDISATLSDAVVLFDVSNFEVSANKVESKDYGIAIIGGFSVGDQAYNGRIFNNMISTQSGGEALYFSYANLMYLYHNTLDGYPALYLSNHANFDVRNNILATDNNYCFYTLNAVSLAAMDNNLYYIANPSGNAVRFGAVTYPTLLDWQTTGPVGYDANSVSGNPIFVNGYYVAGSLPLDTADASLSFAVNEDIDGEIRPQGPKPDIGADEHLAIANDGMVVGLVSPANCGDTTQNVIVSIANLGLNPLVSIPVTVNISGSATASFNTIYPSLTPGATADINMGSINTAAGGNYVFEIIISPAGDLNAANDTLYVSLNLPPSTVNALTFAGDTLICVGNSANVIANVSYSPVNVLWYDAASGGNLVYSGSPLISAALTANTTFYAEIQGCSDQRVPVTVDVDNIGIDLDLGPDRTICGGIPVEVYPTINLSTATSYLWSDGAQTSFVEVSTAGDYALTVTNQNGCTDTDTLTISTTPTPSITSAVVDPSCGGYTNGSIDLTIAGGTGPFTYNWSNSTSSEDATGLSAGVYLVTITDNGPSPSCAYVQFFELDDPSGVYVNIDNYSYPCNQNDASAQITTSGGAGNYTYLWSSGETNQNAQGLSAGSQSVTVTDANGCTTSASTTIPTFTPITMSLDSIVDETVDLAGAIYITTGGGNGGNLQYFWNTGATTEDLSGLTAGTYTLTITDLATGCTLVIDTFTVDYRIVDGLSDIEGLNSMRLYPNPSSDVVWIDISFQSTKIVEFELYNITGQQLMVFDPKEGTEINFSVDMTTYPSGVYLARFIVDNKVFSTKIIVE